MAPLKLHGIGYIFVKLSLLLVVVFLFLKQKPASMTSYPVAQGSEVICMLEV